MSYEVLEKQIKALPAKAFEEVAHYVSYLTALYENTQDDSVSQKVDDFLKKNPNVFDEFSGMKNAGLENIRELTKNDTW